jgi:hypothetical protein
VAECFRILTPHYGGLLWYDATGRWVKGPSSSAASGSTMSSTSRALALAATVLMGSGVCTSARVRGSEHPWHETRVVIGTGSVGSDYYPLGGAVCRLVNLETARHGIRCRTATSSGSVFNVTALREGRFDLAVLRSDVQDDAVTGHGPFAQQGAFTSLRAVLSAMPNRSRSSCGPTRASERIPIWSTGVTEPRKDVSESGSVPRQSRPCRAPDAGRVPQHPSECGCTPSRSSNGEGTGCSPLDGCGALVHPAADRAQGATGRPCVAKRASTNGAGIRCQGKTRLTMR